MDTESLPKSLKKILIDGLALNEDELRECLFYFQKDIIKKDHYFIQAGQIVRHKAVIQEGCTRTFYYDQNMKENTLFFSFENGWLGDIESYHFQKPTELNIQAIEDTIILKISKTDFETLSEKITKLKAWYAFSAVHMYASVFEKLKEAKIRNPEEKYMHLLKNNPGVFQRVPLKYIAAYLEIEPQSLSRLRARLMK